jgi:hypothetical protein
VAAVTDPTENSPPETCAIAFKEWAGVCEGLAAGEQSVILRKGGIAEGPGGFAPEHAVFWLYPTAVHQAEQGLRASPAPHWIVPPQEGTIGLNALAVVAVIGRIDDPALLSKLEPFHIWTAETVSKRFHYRSPGLWVLGVRVFRRREPWVVTVTPEHAGCKTWVPLETPLATDGIAPVLDAESFTERMDRLRRTLDLGARS